MMGIQMRESMALDIISFTEKGIRLSLDAARRLEEGSPSVYCRLFTRCGASGVLPGKDAFGLEEEGRAGAEAAPPPDAGKMPSGRSVTGFVAGSVSDWAGERMRRRRAMLFIGACGIAVRSIAPHLKDKLSDSPVLVMDELGKYVIPVLSGHIGGANRLALLLAERMGAEPIITTATDLNGSFAVDLFARENGLRIMDRRKIAEISSKVLSGQKITMAIEEKRLEPGSRPPEEVRLVYRPPEGHVDVEVSSGRERVDASLSLRPREYVIGMGCRKGKPAEDIDAFIREKLEEAGICAGQVAALASIDLKRQEQGFLSWCEKEGLPFLTCSAEALQKVEGSFHGSDFVKERTGVDNVCERAALCACGPGGKLIVKKCARDGMTIAIAKREWRIRF